MSCRVSGKDIYLTRGDTLIVKVVPVRQNGVEYTPESSDKIRFAMKSSYESNMLLIEKTIPNDTLLLQLDPEDTKYLDFGNYVYDVQLTKANGTIDTFIDRGKFVITEEVD